MPAGWLSPPKPHPANYSLRIPSRLSNGETGDGTLLGALAGLQVLPVSSNTPTSRSRNFFLSILTVGTKWAEKLSLIFSKPICFKMTNSFFRALVSLCLPLTHSPWLGLAFRLLAESEKLPCKKKRRKKKRSENGQAKGDWTPVVRLPNHSVHVPTVQISSSASSEPSLQSTAYIYFNLANVCRSCSIAHHLVLHFRPHWGSSGPCGGVEVRTNRAAPTQEKCI